jgi:hypothetical protein
MLETTSELGVKCLRMKHIRRHLALALIAWSSLFSTVAEHCSGLFGQSLADTQPKPTFHIQGTIDSPWDSMLKGQVVERSRVSFEDGLAIPSVGDKDSPYITMPRSVVRFHGEHLDKTLVVDEKGFYRTDLPVGFYKMSVHGPKFGGQGLQPYVRVFRVTAPTTIVMNATLQLTQLTCDAIPQSDDIEEERKDDCGGDDSSPTPSQDGTPFELFVRYPQRQLTRYGYRYTGSEKDPVFVAYNLFSLKATEVRYWPKHHAIIAFGNVVVEDGSGKTEHPVSPHFTFQDGVAAQFREQLPRPSE